MNSSRRDNLGGLIYPGLHRYSHSTEEYIRISYTLLVPLNVVSQKRSVIDEYALVVMIIYTWSVSTYWWRLCQTSGLAHWNPKHSRASRTCDTENTVFGLLANLLRSQIILFSLQTFFVIFPKIWHEKPSEILRCTDRTRDPCGPTCTSLTTLQGASDSSEPSAWMNTSKEMGQARETQEINFMFDGLNSTSLSLLLRQLV